MLRFPRVNAVGVRDLSAPGGTDFIDHLLVGAGTGSLAVDRRAEIVDDHARPLRRQQQGDSSPDTTTGAGDDHDLGSEEHTSELQSLMRISYAVFCLKNKLQIMWYEKLQLVRVQLTLL